VVVNGCAGATLSTLQDPLAPIVEPYARLPQLTLNAQQNYAAQMSPCRRVVEFSHPTLLNATRIVINRVSVIRW